MRINLLGFSSFITWLREISELVILAEVRDYKTLAELAGSLD